MIHRLTIQYAAPADPDAFDKHYFGTHLGLCQPLPGLRALTWSKPRVLGGEGPYLVTQLDFADAESLTIALRSPEMAAVANDAATLPADRVMFTGEVATSTATVK